MRTTTTATGKACFVGYRWYDSRKLPVRFPFGHGGSYTTFDWGEATLSAADLPAGGTVSVSVPVTNTGDRRGAEVVQCYVRPPQGRLSRPARELAGWAKLWLEPGETATATIELDERAFAYWDPTSPDEDELAARVANAPMAVRAEPLHSQAGWWIDAGTHEVEIGASVADIRQRLSVTTEARRVGP